MQVFRTAARQTLRPASQMVLVDTSGGQVDLLLPRTSGLGTNAATAYVDGGYAHTSPALTSDSGIEFTIKNEGTAGNNVCILPRGTDTIDGRDGLVLLDGGIARLLLPTGSDWKVLFAMSSIYTTSALHDSGGITVPEGTTTLPVAEGISVIRVAGSGGATTLGGTPLVTSGTLIGQLLVLIGTHDTNTVLVPDSAPFALTGTITLGAGDTLTLVWNGTAWCEMATSNN